MANSTQCLQRDTSLNSLLREHPISPRCQPHLKTNYENLEKNYGEENCIPSSPTSSPVLVLKMDLGCFVNKLSLLVSTFT